jgi:fructokinase
MKALSYGEILWDIINDQEHLGGGLYNLAAHLAKQGVDSTIISRVGDDPRGRAVLENLQQIRLGADWVQNDPVHPTGTVTVELSGNGMPSYTIHEGVAYDYIEADEAMLTAIKGTEYDVFCFGTLCQRHAVSRQTLQRILEVVQSRHIFYDVNLRQHYFSKEIIAASMERSTIVKVNDEEAEMLGPLLFGRALDEADCVRQIMKDFDLDVLCLTRGPDGCTVYQGDEQRDVPCPPVIVADTVGAGDSFSSAFLSQYCRGQDPWTSAKIANQLGSYVASKNGAVPEYSAEIQAILNTSILHP